MEYVRQTNDTQTQAKGNDKMLKVTFSVYSPILKKTFVNVKNVKSIEDFRLYAYSLYSGNWSIVSTENV